MQRISIPTEKFITTAHDFWKNDWAVICCGDFASHHYNAMTIGWGLFGVLWSLPVVQVFVRPTRYTFEFFEQYNTFTVNAFPKTYRDQLNLLGTQSGRDGDKIKASRLTPIPASQIAAPAFAEAELIIECEKLYWQDLQPAHFLDPYIETKYPLKDYHRCYIGKVLSIEGIEKYCQLA